MTLPAEPQAIPNAPPVVVRRAWWQSFRIPMRSSVSASHGELGVREGLLIGLETSSGRVGLGEASPLPSYTGGSVEEAARAVEMLSRTCVGKDAALWWTSGAEIPGISPGAFAAARCGIETAAADLLSRGEGLPVAKWLAKRAGIQPESTSSRVPVNAVVDDTEPGDAAQRAGELVARGFGVLKLKVGLNPEADFIRVAKVRRAVGTDVTIRLDANGCWEPDEAIVFLERFANAGVEFVEQPVSHRRPNAIRELAALRAATPVRIAADESCRTTADLEAILTEGAADAVVIKPMACGLREALAMVGMTRERGLPAIVTTMFDAGVGVAVATHLAALLAPPPPACGLATLDYLADDIVTRAPRVEAGVIHVGTEPGLGLELDREALERFGTGLAGEVRL